MGRPKRTCLGDCTRRVIRLEDDRLCDYFEPKRRGKYRVCCRNCKSFEMIQLDTQPSKTEHDKDV